MSRSLVILLLLGVRASAVCEAQERLELVPYGASIVIPEGWVAAPDSVLDLVDEARRGSPVASDAVALLASENAEGWGVAPYVLITADTLQPFRSREEIEADVSDSRMMSPEGQASLAELGERLTGIRDFQAGEPVYDPVSCTLWIRAEATAPSGVRSCAVSASQFYRAGVIRITYYESIEQTLEVGTTLVGQILDSMQLPAGTRFATETGPAPETGRATAGRGGFPMSLLGSVLLDWVAAAVVSGLLFLLAWRYPRAKRPLEGAGLVVLVIVVVVHILGRSLQGP